MPLFFSRMLIFATALSSAACLHAQASPTAEAQLANGYLGDQNSRLTGQNLTGADVYIRKAVDAIAAGDYKRSLAILRPYRLTATFNDLLISGLAHAGLSDFNSARSDFQGALHKRRNFTAAQVELADLEAGHGEKAVALKLLQELTARRDACAGTCPDQAELSSGVDRITATLQARAPSAP